TGKFTGSGGTLEETVTKNNLEAAEEIVRQLRLRDVGGIIVIDILDMVLESNRDLVLRRLVECLGRDRTKHQVAEVTSLGLVQMTRKRVGQGLVDTFSTTCDHCHGRGLHVDMDGTSHTHGNGGGDASSPSSKRRNRRSRSNGSGKEQEGDSSEEKGREAASAFGATPAVPPVRSHTPPPLSRPRPTAPGPTTTSPRASRPRTDRRGVRGPGPSRSGAPIRSPTPNRRPAPPPPGVRSR